ncbi:MAG: hypothetical protein R2795_00075 [Saprospiraceae bacterium]
MITPIRILGCGFGWELDNTPEYSVVLNPLYASSVFDTLQGFTSYLFDRRRRQSYTTRHSSRYFYVGWQQASICEFGSCIAVGYDRNRPQGRAFIYVENSTGWEPISGVTDGALMIRPVMRGEEALTPTDVTEVAYPLFSAVIYPNPTTGVVHLRSPLSRRLKMYAYLIVPVRWYLNSPILLCSIFIIFRQVCITYKQEGQNGTLSDMQKLVLTH